MKGLLDFKRIHERVVANRKYMHYKDLIPIVIKVLRRRGTLATTQGNFRHRETGTTKENQHEFCVQNAILCIRKSVVSRQMCAPGVARKVCLLVITNIGE